MEETQRGMEDSGRDMGREQVDVYMIDGEIVEEWKKNRLEKSGKVEE